MNYCYYDATQEQYHFTRELDAETAKPFSLLHQACASNTPHTIGAEAGNQVDITTSLPTTSKAEAVTSSAPRAEEMSHSVASNVSTTLSKEIKPKNILSTSNIQAILAEINKASTVSAKPHVSISITGEPHNSFKVKGFACNT